MKKYILVILIAFILSNGVVFAQPNPSPQERQLEIDYPDVPGPAFTPQDVETSIPDYVRYIYYFFLGIAGVIALIVIVNAGIGYLTSVGNPSKMQESKDRIMAALLGLFILAGSYGILYTINPDLISLHIPELQPLITTLEPGVLLCKGQKLDQSQNPLTAWFLIEDYKAATNNNERQAIKKQLEPIIEEIYKRCYTVRTKEDIRPEFEDQIIEVWFIPLVVKNENGKVIRESSAEYGAIYYDDKGFEGKSLAYVTHLLGTNGWIPFKANVVSPNMSSIAPFKLIDVLNPNWKVTLFEETNHNEQFAEKKSMEFFAEDFLYYWWDLFSKLPWPPKSMKIEGNLLVILEKVDNSGSYKTYTTESFFSQNVANLEKYENIVEKVPCKDYVSEYSDTCVVGYGGGGSGGVVVVEQECCFKAATTGMLMIGAEPL